MRVALIVPGGVDPSCRYRVIPALLWFIERMARAHELHVFALRQPDVARHYDLLGARVHVMRPPRRARLLATVLAQHVRAPFDVFHGVWAIQGALAALLGSALRRPVVVHLTGGDLVALPEIGYGLLASPRGSWWLRVAATASDRVTVPSRFMQRAARQRGIDAAVLPLGVAVDRWPPRPPRSRPTGRPARLLHVATLNRVKDQTTLVRAAATLRSRGVAFQLDIVGLDTLDGEIQRLATQLGIAAHTTFHGYVPHDRLRPYMEQADLLLMCSRHEADPMVVLEAAVVGVPTVGTAVGHIADWSPDAAVAVPVGDADALADAVCRLLRDDDVRRRLAAAAQERALRCDADWASREVEQLYRALCSGGRS